MIEGQYECNSRYQYENVIVIMYDRIVKLIIELL